MNYEDKYKIFRSEFSITGLSYDELYLLYNIIGYVYLNLKKKSEDITIMKVLDKMVPELPVFDNHLKPVLAMHIQLMLEEQEFKPKVNIKDIAAMKEAVRKILDNWLPF